MHNGIFSMEDCKTYFAVNETMRHQPKRLKSTGKVRQCIFQFIFSKEINPLIIELSNNCHETLSRFSCDKIKFIL